MKTVFTLAIAGLFAGSATAASIHRCVDADGQVSLQSTPCPAGSVTTRTTEVQVAAKPTLPDDVMSESSREGVKRMCSSKHAASFALQAACVRNAESGFDDLYSAATDLPEDSPLRTSIVLCSARYFSEQFEVIDYAMAAACLRNETQGLKELQP